MLRRPLLVVALALVIAAPARAGLSAQFSDPLVDHEWWLAAVGATQVDPPGPGKPLTIVDSGLDMSHPEFAGRPNVTLLNEQTTTGREQHGTEVSSVAAAPTNGIGLVGIYPQVVLRSFDASPGRVIETDRAIEGIDRASAGGPGVISLSWGAFVRDPNVDAAIARAVRAGSLVVAAAGNEREEGSPAVYPADLPHVLTIGATDEANHFSSFSTAAHSLDLVAPGEDIPIADPTSPTGYDFSGAGTSFSAPIVAGAAAWVWTVRPTLDASQVAELLRRTAVDLGPVGWDEDYGFGLLNVAAALVAPAPAPDPQEPNEDVAEVVAGGTFDQATPPLTTATRGRGTVAGRLDVGDDPRDVYRLWIPARGRVTVTASSPGLALSVWRPQTRSVLENGSARRRDLAGGGGRTVAVRGGAKGGFGYVAVAPALKQRSVSYRLTVATR